MSIPAVAKIGVGSTLAIGAPTSIYLTWDHITLYEVERIVINEDMRLSVSTLNTTTKKITVNTPSPSDTTSPKLPKDYSWSCEITVSSTDTSDQSLNTRIQNNLQKANSELTPKQRENKELLVRACARKRREKPKNDTVVGLLELKEKSGSNTKEFLFVDHSELNRLLKEE